MKLRTTLMAAPVLACLVLLLCLTGFLLVVQDYEDKTRATYEAGVSRQQKIAEVQHELAEVHVLLYRTIAVIGSMEEPEVKSRRDSLPKVAAEVRQSLAQVLSADDAKSDAALGFDQSLKKFIGNADMAIDLSTIDPNTGVAALQTADAEHKALIVQLGKLIELVKHRADADVAELDRSLLQKQILIGTVGLLAGLGSFAFAWLMQGRIIRDIKVAADAADDVAEGRFDKVVQVERHDEIGQLQSALARMVQELSTSMNVVQTAALSIGQASSEIAAGNTDLSRRTESTASSLQETASSMEQLTGTVRHTAEAARSADSLAQTATDAARKGGEVMQQVVHNMAEIDTASRKITEIISVIDGIAFQTNILALNAAVEAARAGEQGRGFAVVAGEVRSLAKRSADAAREIKTLIGSSSERVEVGTRLVQDAGASMQDIVAGVERVTQIISEITEAAEQESQGIGQVNVAVTQLDQMTQQNAALVEESAAAAESLKSQARSLSDVVGRFRLADVR
jgi:methyl-accepting chemotaxis protein